MFATVDGVRAEGRVKVRSWRLQAISFRDGPAGSPCRVSASICDSSGEIWSASQQLISDAHGEVRLAERDANDRALDAGWPFWSLRPEEGEGRLTLERLRGGASLAPSLGPLAPIELDIRASFDGGPQYVLQMTRERIVAGVTQIDIKENGLRGVLFAPRDTAPIGSVVVLSGSEGGIVAGRAAALAGEGFAVLALGYFAYQDRPSAAQNLPLEYFQAGLRFMKTRFPDARCAVWGGSRGSEAAVMCGVLFPDLIDAVIGWVPSHVLHGGFDMASGEDFSLSKRSMWSYEGAALPFAPRLGLSEATKNARDSAYGTPPGYRYADEFLASWTSLSGDEDFIMPVEQLQAPLLLVSADDDGLWPSTYAAQKIEERIKSLGDGSQDVTHVILNDCGHAIGMPNEPRPYSNVVYWGDGYSGVDSGFIDYGGSPCANAVGARNGWNAAVDFLQERFIR